MQLGALNMALTGSQYGSMILNMVYSRLHDVLIWA